MTSLVVAVLAGGSLLQTCEVRFRDAAVAGTRNYIRTLLDPSSVLQVLIEQSTTVDEP